MLPGPARLRAWEQPVRGFHVGTSGKKAFCPQSVQGDAETMSQGEK